MAGENNAILLKVQFDSTEAIKKAAGFREEIGKIKAKQKELDTTTEEGRLAYEQYQAELKAVQRELRNTTSLIDSNTRSNKAAAGSYEQLYNSAKIAEVELKTLEGTIEKNEDGTYRLTKAYFDASQKVDEARQALLLFNAGIAQGRLNVGNYGNTLEGMRQKLEDLKLSLKNTDINDSQFEERKKQIEETEKKLEDLTGTSKEAALQQAKERLEANKYGNSLEGLRQKLEDLKAVKDNTDIASDDFKRAGDDVAGLSLLIEQASGKVDEFGNKEPKNPLKKNFEDLSESSGAAVSLLTLLNLKQEQNSTTAKLQAKALQAIAIAQNVANIVKAKGAIIDTIDLVKTKALTIAKRVFALAVGQSSGALGKFRVALISTGIGAIVVAIGTLSANFDGIKKTIAGVVNRFDFLKKVIAPIVLLFKLIGQAWDALGFGEEERLEKQLAGQEKYMKTVEKRYDRQIKLEQAAGKNTEELEKKKLEELNKSIKKQVELYLRLAQLNGELTDEQKEKLEELVETYRDNAVSIRAIEIAKNKSIKDANDKLNLDLLNIQAKREQILSGKSNPATLRAIAKQERDIAVEAAILKGESTTAIEEQYKLRLLEINKEANDQQKKLAADLEKSRIDLIKDAREKAIQEEGLNLKQRLEQYKGSSKIEKEIRENITKASNERIRQINEKFDKEIRDRQLDLTKQALQNEYDAIRNNEQKKLSLKLQLIEVEQQAELGKLNAELVSAEVFEAQKKNIEDKYRIQREKAEEESAQRIKEGFLKQVNDRLSAELINLELAKQLTLSKRLEILANQREQELSQQALTEEQKLLIEAQYQQRVKELRDEARELENQQVNASFEATSDTISKLANLFTVSLKERLTGYDEEIAAIDKQIQAANAAGQNTAALEAEKTAAQEKRSAALEELQKKEERFAAVKSSIDEAQQIRNNILIIQEQVRALTVQGGIPFPANVVAITATLAALAGVVVSARQIASNIQKFEDGGGVPIEGGKMAMITGKRHSQGGSKFINPSTGQMFEAEAGEGMFIMKRDATQALSKLSNWNQLFNGNSWFGDGGTVFADGGYVARSNSRQIETGLQTAEMVRDAVSGINVVARISEINRVNGQRTTDTKISQL